MAGKPDILLVDDDERLRNVVGKVLAAGGHRVVTASSGQEALETLNQETVALVVSDVRLPDLNGIALLKGIRELRPETEVVIIAGHGSIAKAVEAMRFAADDTIADCASAPAVSSAMTAHNVSALLQPGPAGSVGQDGGGEAARPAQTTGFAHRAKQSFQTPTVQEASASRSPSFSGTAAANKIFDDEKHLRQICFDY